MNPLIAAALAMPATYTVVSTYADGSERRHDTRSAAAAESFAVGECRKVGRDLISRETGNVVRVVSVRIVSVI